MKAVFVSRKIQGGDPCVIGTRIPVKSVVYLNKKLKVSPEKIANEYYPQLSTQLVREVIGWWKDSKNGRLAFR